MNIYSCLLALLLACNVTAGINYQGVKEKQQVTLSCPHSVEGKLMWSREINGSKVDILATDGDTDQRFNDPQKRYSSLADKSLFISGAAVSDSGTYYCNNEPAAELTVIPSGTEIQTTERSSINLTCPHDDGGSHVPTWSREIGGKQQPIRLHVSNVTKTLMLRRLRLTDSGLYLCDGKPAVYLNVIKEEKRKPPTTPTSARRQTAATTRTSTTTENQKEKRTPPTTTSTTTLTRRQTAAAINTTTTEKQNDVTTTPTSAPTKNTLYLVLGVVPFILLIIIIIITYCSWRRRFKRREEEYPIYDEIQEGGLQLKKRVESYGRPSATYSLAGFPGTSVTNELPYSLITNPVPDGNKQDFKKQTTQPNQNDPTYYTIPDLPPMGNKTGTSVTNELPYSLITNPLPDGNKQGFRTQTIQSNQNDPTYHTISDPAPTGNRTDTSLTD